MSDIDGERPARRQVTGAPTFIAATRIDEDRPDVSFQDALLLARLVIDHGGAPMPTRGKKAITNGATARRLARLGLASLDEGVGRSAGTRGRSAWTIRASAEGTELVRSVLAIEAPVPYEQVRAEEPPPAAPVPATLAEWEQAILRCQDVSDSRSQPDLDLPREPEPAAEQASPVHEPDGGELPDDDAAPPVNRKAEDLWGLPDASGRYLTYIVVHGDDMSEEDYSKLGNHLLGALNNAASSYGYGRRSWNLHKSIIGSRWDDTLVAELPDGTLIAASSTQRRGSGWAQDTRRPTPQEHARWAGLPVPPEPPPPPPPPPSIVDVVWDQITQHVGESFSLIGGTQFTYSTSGTTVTISLPKGRNRQFTRWDLGDALAVWPVPGPSALLDEHVHGASHIWGVLADDRILGLRDPGTGAIGVDAATGADPNSPAPGWLAGTQPTEPTATRLVADLFDPTPDRWGLRGDPFLWDALRAGFEDTPVPDSPTDLQALLFDRFQEIVGEHPLDRHASESVYVEELAHGGMPSGHIHLPTWRDQLLPTIVGRSIGRRV